MENIQKLKDLGYKSFHDGFVDVQFSDPVRALHGCTPGEILHAFQLGIAERSIEACFGAKKQSREGKKKSKRKAKIVRRDKENAGDTESESEDEGVDESDGEILEVEAGDLSTHNVFSQRAKIRVDDLARKLHRHLKWQSDKGLPRTTFPNGITHLSKLQGNERSGVLLMLLIIMVMEHWALWRLKGASKKLKSLSPDQAGYLEQAMGDKRSSNVIKSLALLLSFEQHMRLERVSMTSLKHVERFIPQFMDQVLRTFPRTEGTGNNLIKNHLPLHYADDVRRHGSARNSDSGIGEKVHKTSAKLPGRRTNKTAETFETRTAINYVDMKTIERGWKDHHSCLDTRKPNTELPVLSNRVLTVRENDVLDNRGTARKALDWRDSHIGFQELVDFARKSVMPRLSKRTVGLEMFSRLSLNNEFYAANPCHGSSGLSKQDWGRVKMSVGRKTETFPCQFLLFFEMTAAPTSSIELNGSSMHSEGIYALVHASHQSLKETGKPPYAKGDMEHNNEGTLAHADQLLIHRVTKSHLDSRGEWVPASTANEASVMIVPVEAIVGPCIGIPDILCSNSRNEYLVLVPVSEWAAKFEEMALKENSRR